MSEKNQVDADKNLAAPPAERAAETADTDVECHPSIPARELSKVNPILQGYLAAKYDRIDSGMEDDERGIPYTMAEARGVAEDCQDPYLRDLLKFLLRRIERLSKSKNED